VSEPTPTAPSSQPAPAASPSPAPAAPAAASPSNPATDGTPSPTATAKPEWLPEQFWDTTKNEPKGKDFRTAYDELSSFKAAEDVRRLALPAAPDKYEPKLPKDFAAPEGLAFEINGADPLWAQARDWAHKNGLSQEAFEQGVALIAARDIGSQQSLKAARDQQIAALGPNGTARVTAINTFLDGKGVPELKGMLVTSDIVKAMEKVIGMVSASSNYQPARQPGEVPDKVSDDEWSRMSFSERREYAAKHANGRAA
jgi:hypothetical protein